MQIMTSSEKLMFWETQKWSWETFSFFVSVVTVISHKSIKCWTGELSSYTESFAMDKHNIFCGASGQSHKNLANCIPKSKVTIFCNYAWNSPTKQIKSHNPAHSISNYIHNLRQHLLSSVNWSVKTLHIAPILLRSLPIRSDVDRELSCQL